MATNYAGDVLATLWGLISWSWTRFMIFYGILLVLALFYLTPWFAVALGALLIGVWIYSRVLQQRHREQAEIVSARHFLKYGRPAQPW